jgi:hypothetical protein
VFGIEYLENQRTSASASAAVPRATDGDVDGVKVFYCSSSCDLVGGSINASATNSGTFVEARRARQPDWRNWSRPRAGLRAEPRALSVKLGASASAARNDRNDRRDAVSVRFRPVFGVGLTLMGEFVKVDEK